MKYTHKRCAFLSNLIYNPLINMDTIDNQTIIIDNNIIGIFVEEGIHYIVFQGSNDYEDWLINFQFTKTEVGMHSGFNKSANKIEKTLKKELDPNIEYIFTGHSMGGALALILGIRMKAKEIVTFGQPRVLSEDDDTYDVSKIHRYVTPEDIVPNTPPSLFGYKHIGRPYFILSTHIHDGDMKFYDKILHKIHKSAQKAIQMRQQEHNIIFGAIWMILSYFTFQGKNSITAHSSENYKDKLNP
jgi:hypothetical protein